MRATVRCLLLLLLFMAIVNAQFRQQKRGKTKKSPLQSLLSFWRRGAKRGRQVSATRPKVVKTRQVSHPPPPSPPSPPSKTPVIFRLLKTMSQKKRSKGKRPKQVPPVPQLTPSLPATVTQVPFQVPPQAFEDLRFDRQVGNFKPSPKDKIYLDQLIGQWIPGKFPSEYNWQGINMSY